MIKTMSSVRANSVLVGLFSQLAVPAAEAAGAGGGSAVGQSSCPCAALACIQQLCEALCLARDLGTDHLLESLDRGWK